MNKHIHSVSFVILSLALLQGCIGYQFGSSLPPDIQYIFIPTFVNKSHEPLIEVKATNATITEFQQDGTLKIADLDQADVILECILTEVTLDPLRYSKQDKRKPNEYRLTLHASFILKRADSNIIVGEDSAIGESTFIFTGNLASAKRGAIPEASEDLAKRIVEKVVEIW